MEDRSSSPPVGGGEGTSGAPEGTPRRDGEGGGPGSKNSGAGDDAGGLVKRPPSDTRGAAGPIQKPVSQEIHLKFVGTWEGHPL